MWYSFFVLFHQNYVHYFSYACQLPRPSYPPCLYLPNKLSNSENYEPLLSNLHTPFPSPRKGTSRLHLLNTDTVLLSHYLTSI